MNDTPAARLDAIRRLNDAARVRPGASCIANMTAGIAELPADQRAAIVRLVVAFDNWTEDNDPYGEHDFGPLYRLASGEWTQIRPDAADQIAQTAFWKIDYYDKALRYGSEQPWNAEATARVLTILLASEY